MIIVMAIVAHLAWPSFLNAPKASNSTPAPQARIGNRIQDTTYRKHGWLVNIRTDGFTGEMRCYVSSRQTRAQNRITYADDILGFQFDQYLDMSGVWFRVDDQPARRWTSVYPTLNARHAVVTPYGADRERTIVLIPRDDIGEASYIYIRASEKEKPRRFRLEGFKAALDFAEANGCQADSFRRP